MSKIIIIGAGGHAKVCIEILRRLGEDIAYCIGDSGAHSTCLGIPVLRGDENLVKLRSKGYKRAFVAVGSNELRIRLAEKCVACGYSMLNAISSEAIVSESANIGIGVAIMPGAIINAEAVISDFSIINTGASVDHECSIGRGVHIAPHCALAGNVVVGNLSFAGIGSKVIPKIEIGERVILGAGSVVVNDIEPAVLAVGVPARIVRKL